MRMQCSLNGVAFQVNFCAKWRNTVYSRRCDSMLRKLEHFGHVLTDENGWPRYWSTAWSLLAGAGLAPATLKKRLLHIDDFYTHVESTLPRTNLDDSLGSLEFTRVEDLLESYFVSLRNVSKVSSTAGERW